MINCKQTWQLNFESQTSSDFELILKLGLLVVPVKPPATKSKKKIIICKNQTRLRNFYDQSVVVIVFGLLCLFYVVFRRFFSKPSLAIWRQQSYNRPKSINSRNIGHHDKLLTSYRFFLEERNLFHCFCWRCCSCWLWCPAFFDCGFFLSNDCNLKVCLLKIFINIFSYFLHLEVCHKKN